MIPTLNAGDGFEALLEGISRQRGVSVQTLVVDSGSTDGTQDLALGYGATVHEVPRRKFDHGATRNLGVSLSGGEYVALTVQDAVPADDNWLAAMVENLRADDNVAGVYGRQTPHPQASALARSFVGGLATASLTRREQFIEDAEAYRATSAVERRRIAAFDDVSSCIRRSVWEEIPLERASFGEDLRWGKRVVEAGYKLVYEPRSVVRHSHERGGIYDLRRHYVDAALLSELFGAGPVGSLGGLLRGTPPAAVHRYRLLRKEPGGEGALYLAAVAARYAALSRLGAYLGGGSERISRDSPRLHRFLSKGV